MEASKKDVRPATPIRQRRRLTGRDDRGRGEAVAGVGQVH